MAIEGISASRVDQPIVAVQPSATVNSQRQSTEASARITEPVKVEKERVSNEGGTLSRQPEESQAQESRVMDTEALKKRISDLNRQLNSTECQYGVDEITQRVTLKIVDKETKEVIKELPPEKTLKMIAKVWELAGLLVDEKR